MRFISELVAQKGTYQTREPLLLFPTSEMSLMEHPCSSEEHSSAVEPSEEATFDTVREIRSHLENIQEKRKRDLARAHRALLNGDSTHGLQDVNVINDEIKALFESVERLLKLSPSPGVQAQWNRQQRSFKEEAIQCSEANLKFKKRWKEIRNANQRRQINNNGTHGDINSIESQLQNPRQFQFTSRRATPVRELIERSNRIHQYEENIEDINDMTAYLHKLVHRQEPSIVQIEDNVVTTARESGKASADLNDAAASAQNNRRWKWYAFILMLVIVIVLGIIVGSVIGFRRTDKPSHSSRV